MLIEADILSSAYKNSAFTFSHVCSSSVRCRPSSHSLIVLRAGCAMLSSLLSPPSPSATNDSQWRTTASTTTLNMVDDSGPPCVVPLSPQKFSL